MSKKTCISWPEDFEAAYTHLEMKVQSLVFYLARKLGVFEEREDILHSVWLHVKRKWEKISKARYPLCVVMTIAVRKVIDAASYHKVRIHVCFVQDWPLEVILKALSPEFDFAPLQRIGPTGLPMYSAKVWKSKVDDISRHPAVAYCVIKGRRACDSMDDVQIEDPTRSAKWIEVRAEINRCIESIRSKLTTKKAKVLELCDLEGLSEGEVARQLGLKPCVVRRYHTDAWAILRQECPWLENYI